MIDLENSMILEFELNKQTLKRIDNYEPVEKSQVYLQIHFNFDKDWDNTEKHVFFQFREEKVYEEILVGDTCYVPLEVIKKYGFYLWLVGYDLETHNVKIPTNQVRVAVKEGSPTDSGEATYVTDIVSDTITFEKSGNTYRAEIISKDFQNKLIDAFDADTILESINQNGKASVEQALRTINYWTTQIGAFIEEVFTGKIVNKAIADQKGNVIDAAVYQPKLISGYSVGSILGDINEIDGKASIEKSLKQINVVLGNFNQYISNIVNGTTVVDKAKNDRNGNVIDLTYATKNALTALENKISQLIAGAPDAFDTLKEIAEYISKDQSGASAMTASINKNAQNIEELKTNSATKQELLETEKLIDVKIEDAIISKLRSDY